MLKFTAMSGTAYRQTVFSMLTLLEGSTRRAYLDTAASPAPTIGIGFNLRYNLEPVLKAMLGTDWNAGLQAKLKTVVDKSYGRGETALLNARLDKVMAEHGGVQKTFGFSSNAQISKALVAIAPGYEAVVDRWIAKIPQSTERAVLFSLAWNGPSLLGPKLKAAVLSGDRAEAWYEIRYNSNGSGHDGIANRRYVEAEHFKLFAGKSATKAEALDAGLMYTAHRQKILAYEKAHDPDAAGRIKGMAEIDAIAREIAPAITRLKAAYGIAKAMKLEELQIASAATRNLSGDGTAWDSTKNDADLLIGSAHANTLKGGRGNDALLGLGGRDKLYGNAGNDRLDGGKGADLLSGGAGADVFVFRSAADIGNRAGARDRITDFQHGRDKIDLSAVDDLTFLAARGKAFTGHAGDLRWSHATEKGKPVTLVQGDLDGDRKADFTLELAGKLTLTKGDFIL